MKIGAFITMTNPYERGDNFIECYNMAIDCFDTVTIVDGEPTWPYEFKWDLIGQHFQMGYEQTDADWVFHLDCDFFFSEYHFDDIREACERHNDQPALSFWKYQFILPDRYNLKSRLVLGVNKAKYGDRIKFNSGGDLCQPSLDDNYISPDDVPEARVPFYNYEKLIKSQEQIAEDVQRMDRAYYRHFGKWLYSNNGLGAYEGWYSMAKGRFSKPQEFVNLIDHPKYIQRAIRKLTPEMFGYNGFGLIEGKVYGS